MLLLGSDASQTFGNIFLFVFASFVLVWLCFGGGGKELICRNLEGPKLTKFHPCRMLHTFLSEHFSIFILFHFLAAFNIVENSVLPSFEFLQFVQWVLQFLSLVIMQRNAWWILMENSRKYENLVNCLLTFLFSH